MYDPVFYSAIEVVLNHEGGYVNDPRDPGGETKFGISKHSYPNLDIKNLTRDQAVDIYYRDFWKPFHWDLISSEALATKVLDLGVTMGGTRANMLLQEAVNDASPGEISVDGQLGSKSLWSINHFPNPDYLVARFRLRAIRYYLDCHKPVYLAGWVERALS